jgi:hypothetical protein
LRLCFLDSFLSIQNIILEFIPMPLQPIIKQKTNIQYLVVNYFFMNFCSVTVAEILDSVTVFKGNNDLYFGFDLLYLLILELITMRQ